MKHQSMVALNTEERSDEELRNSCLVLLKLGVGLGDQRERITYLHNFK